jgi:hypothetical protein
LSTTCDLERHRFGNCKIGHGLDHDDQSQSPKHSCGILEKTWDSNESLK